MFQHSVGRWNPKSWTRKSFLKAASHDDAIWSNVDRSSQVDEKEEI